MKSEREGGSLTVLMKKGVNLWQNYSWQADYPQLPSDLAGQTFSHVFGTNQGNDSKLMFVDFEKWTCQSYKWIVNVGKQQRNNDEI